MKPPVSEGQLDETYCDEETLVGSNRDLPTVSRVVTPYICVVSPPHHFLRFPLEELSVSIGRSPEADIVLNDAGISRIHCRLKKDNKGILVEDLNSTNGSLVNGEPVTKDYLPLSGRLQVGDYILKVEYKCSSEISYEERLLQAATMDPLTGIPNRQWIMEQSQKEVHKHSERPSPITAVMLDIDHFKAINDRYGHQCGDQVLAQVAQRLSKKKRKGDLLGRYGGEEFVMLLPETSDDEAYALCDRLRQAIHQSPIESQGKSIEVTLSIGIYAAVCEPGARFEDLLEQADIALYSAKRQGRNRVVVFSES